MFSSHSFPRQSKILIAIALVAYVALLFAGPWNEAILPDRLFSFSLVLSVTLLTVFLSRRLGFSLILSTLVFGTILISSQLKFIYLTTPLLAPDLMYFTAQDLWEVLLHYPSLLGIALFLMVLVPASLILSWRIDRPFFLAHLALPVRHSLQALGIITSIALLIVIALPQGPFAAVFDKGMWVTMIDKSYITDFTTSFYETQVTIPSKAENVQSSLVWTEDSNRNPSPTCAQTHACGEHEIAKPESRHPDIVAILEESTFDPRMLQICTSPVCKRKMFVPDARSRAGGYLAVHTWGGGTWTAEFALLTGLNHLSFGDAGLYAPYNIAPRINYSLPMALKDAGYRTIAIYPMSGDFINARNAYKFYGFDAFYEGSNYGLSWESSDNDLMQVFDQIYDAEKKSAGLQPLFIFMLTIRQHGPHMDPLNTLPDPFKKPLFPTLDQWLNLNLGNYLARLAGSDSAITHIEKKLLESKQPTALLHFGDHQPSFDGAINVLKKILPASISDTRYISYYMLKTNFKTERKYDYPIIDISFLGALLLDTAKVYKNEFFQANELMRERCKGFYFDCKDKELVDSYHNYIFHEISALHD